VAGFGKQLTYVVHPRSLRELFGHRTVATRATSFMQPMLSTLDGEGVNLRIEISALPSGRGHLWHSDTPVAFSPCSGTAQWSPRRRVPPRRAV